MKDWEDTQGAREEPRVVPTQRRKSAENSSDRLICMDAYSMLLDRVFRDVVEESDHLEGQRALAVNLLRELSGLEPSQRRLLVENSARYHSWGLAEELLAGCRQIWTENPSEAENLAQLAVTVTECLRLSGFRALLLNDLKAQAWTYIGNCRRIQSDFLASQKAFSAAAGHLDRGSGDSLERARFFDLKASLLAAQRDYAGAKHLLGAAIGAYRDSGDRHLEGRALLKLAKFLRDSGDVQDAVIVMEQASRLIRPESEPWLKLTIKNNLLHFYTDLGRTDEAQALLPEVRELATRLGSRLERLRLLWTEALLRARLGQMELAEEALKQTRQGFVAADIGYDVALVSLDLAALYLRSGQTDKVRELAVETMPIFASRNVHRELLVAWQLFKEAAERDAATLRLVEEVAARIRDTHGAAVPDAPA